MARCLDSVRALAFLAIGVGMLFSGVVEADNPCYAECVQDCLNTCSFIGCAACPAICGTHNTCKNKKNLEINSVKPEEVVAIQKDIIEKNYVGVVEGNPCYAECVQDCLNTCSFVGCAACPAICGTHNTCKKKKNLELNSVKLEEVVAIQKDMIEKNYVGVVAGNPCYAECLQDCLNTCSFVGCAACPAICGTHNTCKKRKNLELNSEFAQVKPEEVVAIQKDIIEKNCVGVVADNPCYAECVQDCLNTCSFVGCAACPAICGTHNTCKKKKNLELNSVKHEEVVANQKDIIEENYVEVVAGNPCYAECVQDCLNTCSFVGCAACPAICGTHNTCKKEKNLELNSVKPEEVAAIQKDTVEKNYIEIVAGKPEDVAKIHVGAEARKTLRKNPVADE